MSKRKKWKSIDNSQTIIRDESDWIIVPDCHEPLVSMETYEAAQNAILAKGKYKRENSEYLLRSLVRCGVCGRVMTRHKKGTKTPAYYYCEKSRYTEGSPCPTYERFYEADLERIVVQSLSQLLQTVVDSDKRVQEAAAKSQGSAENIRRSLLRIDQTIKQNTTAKMVAYESYADGKITRDAFIRRRDELASDIERLKAEKETLTAQLSSLEQAQSSELHEVADTASEFLKAEDVTNEMLRLFIDRVNVFTGGRVEIVYRFSDPFMDSLAELQAKPV